MLFQPGLNDRFRAASPLVIRVLVGLLTAFAISPFFLTLRPPMQDFPQHLAAGHVLLAPNDPELRFSDYFTSEWLGSQYLGIYVLIGLFYHPLTWLVEQPLLVASRLSVAVLVLAWAASGEWLGARLLRRHGVGLFFLVLFFNAHLILGFLNFLLGIAACFLTLALFAHIRARKADGADKTPIHLQVLFGLAALVTFYFHVVPFAMVLAVLATAFVGDVVLPKVIRQLRKPRHALAATDYVAGVPALLAVCAWLVSPAGQSTRYAAAGGDDKIKAVFTSVEANTAALDAWLMDVFRSEWDTKLMYIAVGVLVVYIAFEWLTMLLTKPAESAFDVAPTPDRILIWLLRLGAPACALAYYVAPASYDWIWPINARFPLLALLLLPFWLPVSLQRAERFAWLPSARAVTLVALTSVLSAAAASETLLARDAFRGFSEEMEGLDEVLAAIPKGKKVATLVFERGSRFVAFSPFLHVGAYYQAERGGVSYFSFNDFPQSPVRFLPDDRPPKAKPRWEWKPETVRPDEDLKWFDYLIVRGGPATLRSTQTFTRELTAGRFRLFRSNHSVEREDDVASP